MNIKSVKKVFFVFVCIILSQAVLADEGMWLVNLVGKQNYHSMKQLGYALPSDAIYSEEQPSIKDAIVSFGGFCSASVISDQGLLLTNHHCGFSAIVQLSTLEQDYIKHGFIAQRQEEELHAPGLFVKFLIKIADVTDFILKNVSPEMTERERSQKIEENRKLVVASLSEGTHYQVEIVPMFYGNEFYAFVYEVFTDIRLVAAPPSCIGNFGGETDNWKWPRHTGDFALFRVYASKDNKPAPFSKENVPYKPKKWLSISLAGYQENDFAMIIGYPGRTNRYITSYGVEELYHYFNPSAIQVLNTVISTLDEQISTNPTARLRYADAFSTSANIYKYLKGQNIAIRNLEVVERKKMFEDDFESWASNPAIIKTDHYEQAIPLIMMSYRKLPELTYVHNYFRYGINRHLRSFQLALKFQSLMNELSKSKPDQKTLENYIHDLTVQSKEFFSKFHRTTERKIFEQLLQLYVNNVPAFYHPQFFKDIEKKYNKDFRVYADMAYSTSIFTDSTKCMHFLKKPSGKQLQNDPIFIAAVQFHEIFRELQKELSALRMQLEKGMRLYVKGLREMFPERRFYPDANSTMRVTYGKIKGYKSRDAVYYNYITYLDGVIEKEDPYNEEFHVPQKLKDLYYSQDFGIFADKQGRMPTCFIADLDITGGNSGSPVLNSRGEIIGITFDGNWEAMSMDLMFEPELQRAINVDIRYVLFILDKFSGASHLLKEMTFVN